MRKSLVTAALAICSLLSIAAAAEHSAVMGRSYEEARSALIKKGYKPLTREEIKTAGLDSPTLLSFEKDMISKGMSELESCTAAGIQFCHFLLKDSRYNVYRVKVYIPEGGGDSRVEGLQDLEISIGVPVKEKRDLKTLQQRIAMTNSHRSEHARAELSLLAPCDQSCISKETYRFNNALPTFVDPETGYKIEDFRGLDLLSLRSRLAEYSPIKFVDKKYFKDDLQHVINEVTGGALENCELPHNGIVRCSLLVRKNSGLSLYKLDAEGHDLASFKVTNVRVVDGDPLYGALVSKDKALAAKSYKLQKMFESDKAAYRFTMQAENENSNDSLVKYVNGLSMATYESGICNQLISQAYSVALSGYDEPTKANILERLTNALARASCVRMEFR